MSIIFHGIPQRVLRLIVSLFLLFPLALLGCANSSQGRHSPSPSVPPQVVALDRLFATDQFSGAVLVARAGKILLSKGYSRPQVPANYIDMSIPFAAGALASTVEDLYRWDQGLFNGTFARGHGSVRDWVLDTAF